MSLTIMPAYLSPQHQAANPKSSCWVGASAGTGKTKVLIDRLLQLLLAGYKADVILCLTFTKAAAAEMQNRLTQKLQEWATLEDKKLQCELENLLGTQPKPDLCDLAKRLFFQVLDTPGGLKIQTIHSFCQSLLQRFPLEAGIDPAFDLIEEAEAKQILIQAQEKVLDSNDPKIQQALEKIVRQISDFRFEELLQNLQSCRGQFSQILSHYPSLDSYKDSLTDFLQNEAPLAPSNTETLLQACTILATHGTATDQKNALLLQESLAIGNQYFAVFLTQDGQIRQKLAGKEIQANFPDIYQILEQEARRAFILSEQEKNKQIISATLAFMTLTQAILNAYQQEKQKRGLLDFEDLIVKTNELLRCPGVSDWVFYKLDGGLDHILIDEAQDTSLYQWNMLMQLVESFFTPDKPYRTLFVVGDIKQSIYSFQGAKPDLFASLCPYFQQKISDLQQPWNNVQLDVSFRTTPAILEVVDRVFDLRHQGVRLLEELIRHIPHRKEQPGIVELLPLVNTDDFLNTEEESWPLPLIQREFISSYSKLALQITEKIKRLLESHEILPCTKESIQPRDILILVRKRSELVPLVLQSLKRQNIPVAGSDRLSLKDHIAIMDLIALGNFLCLPSDDYSLACVLKSPLINEGKGLSEEELFQLCHNRNDSLWGSLKKHAETSPIFADAYNLLKSLLDKVDYESPYNLYRNLLQQTECYFIARLGNECAEVLSEFLQQVFTFEQRRPHTLQGFINHLASLETEIKRGMGDNSQNQVRIMTIHASKGLQAPIVILADSTDQQTLQNEDFLWHENKDKPLFILKPNQKTESSTIALLKEQALEKIKQEHNRLFYVALTRPQDRLYVVGIEKKSLDDTWYGTIQTILKEIGEQTPEGGWYYQPLAIEKETTESTFQEDVSISLPEWLLEKPEIIISKKDKDKDKAPNTDAIQRGVIIHKLFEVLPQYSGRDLKNLANDLIALNKWETLLYPHDIDNVLEILKHPDYQLYFGPDSFAEIAVTNKETQGRIDRLWIGDNVIAIIDYKTSVNPPTELTKVPHSYKEQLSGYASALQAIYKNHSIRTFLLWTEGPHLMEIPYMDVSTTLTN